MSTTFSDSLVQEHTLSQRRLRGRIHHQSLRAGVRLAVRALFGFTHRDPRGDALWSDREDVWLGRATYLHWAMHDAAIDIPWLVRDACDAPASTEELDAVVRQELLRVWSQRLTALPCKSTPAWLPLP